MATLDGAPATEPVTTVTVDTSVAVEATGKPEKVVKEKKARVPKEKKPKAAKATAAHPTYQQMVKEAIISLKERTGSSQYAIAKFLEDHYKTSLPPNFKKTLSVQLRNLSKNGKLTKVKNSFKLSEELKKSPTAAKTPKVGKSVKATTATKESKKAGGSRSRSAVKLKSNAVGAPKTSTKKAPKATKAKATKVNKVEVKASKPLKQVKASVKVDIAPEKTTKRKAPSSRKAPAPKADSSKKASTPKKSATPKKVVKSIKSAKSPKVSKSPKVKGTTRKSTAGTAKKAKK